MPFNANANWHLANQNSKERKVFEVFEALQYHFQSTEQNFELHVLSILAESTNWSRQKRNILNIIIKHSTKVPD